MDASSLSLLSAGCATAASAAGLGTWFRMRRAAGAADAADATSDGDDADASLWRRVVAPVAVYLRPTDPEELHQLETQLLMAGRRSRQAIDRFCEERIVVVLAGITAAILAASSVARLGGVMLAMGSLVLGLIGPRKLLAMRAAERREAVAGALPGAIDLLTTCIDAGLSLEHALARVARELTASAPVLAGELATTSRELEAGVSLADGLRRLSRRVGLDDLSALCGVLAQAHGLGAPIGNTLREFAASSRRARAGLLEERAGKLAAQLTLPLAACLMPAAMLVILGPAALQLVRALH